jgi:pyruvate, water dikinase
MITTTGMSALVDATDAETFGPKAVQLGAALRAGLPVPDGLALSHHLVSSASVGAEETEQLASALERSGVDAAPRAVRSSAVGEDSAESSFAGIHLSLLGVCGALAVAAAVREVRASAQDAGAIAYRSERGIEAPIRMAVIVQELVDSDAAGVMFTRNPVTGAEERVIEASWGLGESVVAGLVTPDRYVLDTAGALTGRQIGEKDLTIRRSESGGTVEEAVTAELIDVPCLGDPELAALHELALRCDDVFRSTEHDIEFAFRNGRICLLQRRPITRV